MKNSLMLFAPEILLQNIVEMKISCLNYSVLTVKDFHVRLWPLKICNEHL